SLLLANQPFTQLTRPTTLVKFGPGYQFLDDTVNVEIINTQTLVATMPPGYPKILDDELPFYKTNSITLTSSAGVPGDVWLYVDTFGTGFNLNGNSTSNNSVIVNTYTDSIAVEWNIKNYYDTRAVIYQIETDLVDGSNIYLEVGEVIINQRVLLGPEVKKQPNELVRTINFSNEYLNNALMYFDSSLEFIHDQDVKTTSASLTLDKQNFTTHLNSLTTEKQNNFFAWSNALSKYAPPSIIKWQNVLGFSDLITLISSRNYTKFQQGKLDWFFTKSTRTMKFTNTSGNVRVQTFNFNTLFSPTYQKFRESDTIFFDSIGYLSPKGPKLFSIENLAKFIEYPNTFGNINTEIFTNPSTEYSAPITADSELLDFSLLKEHTTESFLPAETIFT
ncbi:hypothetical protein EBU71_21880, partial [bacterium]|nr:hypothetical protein [Candidatus Elulimicrobium humile]